MAYCYLRNDTNTTIYLLKWRDNAHTTAQITEIAPNDYDYDSGSYGFSFACDNLPDNCVINFNPASSYDENATFYTCSKSTSSYSGHNILGWDDSDGNFKTRIAPTGNYNSSIIKIAASSKYTSLTKNLNNCSVSFNDGLGSTFKEDSIPIGEKINAVFAPSSGFQWETAPTISNGTETIATGTIPTGKTGTITIPFTVPETTIVNGECSEISKVSYSKVTTRLTNCSITNITDGDRTNIPTDEIEVGSEITFTLTPSKNYEWEGNPTVSDGVSTIATGKYSDVKSEATITVTATDTMTITGSCVQSGIPINENVTYGRASYTPDVLHLGETLNVTFTANNGYYFAVTPTIDYYNELGTNHISTTVSDDGLTATGSFDTSTVDNITSISLIGVATLLPSVPTVSNSLIKAYKITQDGLTELATKRWDVATGEGTETIDLAYYITSLKKFYCDIPTSLDTTLVLYTYDTKISSSIVSGDVITLDCGEISIESTNENNNDYENTNVEIMLPFIGLTPLDSTTVGKTLHLTYDISTITGDCVAKIEIDGITRFEFSGNASEDVPYILNNVQWQLKGSVSFNSTSLYGLIPFVLVSYHDNYNDNNELVIDDEKRAKLDTLTGLNYVNDVVIDDMTIPDDVKELIKNKLSNGVIF